MTMNGIDISSHQTGINLAAVPADFVIVKTTQGNWYVNPDADRAYQQAKKAGKLLGIYHYIDGRGGAAAEVDYFINNCRGYLGEALIAVDWEIDDNTQWGNTAYLEQVVRGIIEKTGIRPLIYGMQAGYAQLKSVADKLNCGLWVAQYANYEPTGYQAHPWNEGAYGCAIRQYTSAGRLAGYNGNLDLNIAYMDRNAWMKYAAKNGNKPAAAPSKPAAPAKKSEDTIAAEVIAGKWGNGQDRINRLKKAATIRRPSRRRSTRNWARTSQQPAHTRFVPVTTSRPSPRAMARPIRRWPQKTTLRTRT